MYACVIWDCDVGLLEDRLTDGDFCYFHGGMGGGSLPPPPVRRPNSHFSIRSPTGRAFCYFEGGFGGSPPHAMNVRIFRFQSAEFLGGFQQGYLMLHSLSAATVLWCVSAPLPFSLPNSFPNATGFGTFSTSTPSMFF